jgi:SAM-dependent MidA family methyltransferase
VERPLSSTFDVEGLPRPSVAKAGGTSDASELQTELLQFIRDTIRARGPQTFAWFMHQALYHPEQGYYSSDLAQIGRRGDYFTNVSVGPIFGRLLAAQFAEMWENLGSPDHFEIVEQGAHHGDFARDVLEAAGERVPAFFQALTYRIVEPFPILQDRQSQTLKELAGKVSWQRSLDELKPFAGVHFSNELLDAMPVHLIVRRDQEWREKFVTESHDKLAFVEAPLSSAILRDHVKRIPAAAQESYETEVNIAALDWINHVSRKLVHGYLLAVDYGYTRDHFYAAERPAGTLLCFSKHKRVSSPLEAAGEIDITAHVDWTSLAERAEASGLQIDGFTDQHHFITGLISELGRGGSSEPPANASPARTDWGQSPLPSPKERRGLQTLLHPEFLGTTFQFLALRKNVESMIPLMGFKYARPARPALGI